MGKAAGDRASMNIATGSPVEVREGGSDMGDPHSGMALGQRARSPSADAGVAGPGDAPAGGTGKPGLLAVCAAVCVLAACTTPPVREFEGFSQAFEEARASTYLLVQDYEQAIAPATAEVAAGEAPATFDPAAFRKRAVPGDADSRRRAVDAVVRYNETMLALARGSSLESVKATMKPLGNLLSLAGPQFNLGGAFVEGLMQRALQARDNAEFVRAFEETTLPARDGVECRPEAPTPDATCVPIIEGIVEVLMQDTREYYDAQRGSMNERLEFLGGEFEAAADPLFELGERFARPAASSALGLGLAELEEAYLAAARAVTPAAERETIVPGSGGATYTQTTQASLQALMVPVAAKGQRASELRQGLGDYHAALGRYVMLLDRSLELLRETQVAAARPPDLFAIVERMSVLRSDVASDGIGTREAILRAITALR